MTGRERKLSAISVEDVGFFEGAEKLLEVWFNLNPQVSRERGSKQMEEPGAKRGLRIIPRYVSCSEYTLFCGVFRCCSVANLLSPSSVL